MGRKLNFSWVFNQEYKDTLLSPFRYNIPVPKRVLEGVEQIIYNLNTSMELIHF